MKYLKTFEKYVETDPINFENVFKITNQDITDVISDLIDKYDYLDFELTTNDYEKFNIEIFEEGLEADPTQDLEDEYKYFKKMVLDRLKSWLDSCNLRLEKHHYDKDTNRIIIEVSRISVRK